MTTYFVLQHVAKDAATDPASQKINNKPLTQLLTQVLTFPCSWFLSFFDFVSMSSAQWLPTYCSMKFVMFFFIFKFPLMLNFIWCKGSPLDSIYSSLWNSVPHNCQPPSTFEHTMCYTVKPTLHSQILLPKKSMTNPWHSLRHWLCHWHHNWQGHRWSHFYRHWSAVGGAPRKLTVQMQTLRSTPNQPSRKPLM